MMTLVRLTYFAFFYAIKGSGYGSSVQHAAFVFYFIFIPLLVLMMCQSL